MADLLRVLIIEDSEDDTLLMTAELELAGFRVESERVDDIAGMTRAIESEQWHLILADYRLPHFTGLDALRLAQERGLDIPFILVSGKIGEDVAVEAMKAGAHDYIMKNNLARLAPAVRRELRDAEARLERKRLDEKLLKSEFRFRQIYDNAPVMMHSIDRKGIVRNVNIKWLSDMGYERDEIVGQKIESFMSPKSRPELWVILSRFWLEGQAEDINYQYVKKDGTVIDVLLDAVVVHDPIWGEVSLSVVRDITAQRLAENSLKESEERYRTLIESMNEGFAVQDSDGNITYANNKLCEMLQSSQSDLIGRSARDFLSGFDQNVEQHLQMINDTSYEVSWKGRQGAKVATIMSPRPLFDYSGEFIGSCAVVTDITEMKKKEQELAGLRHQLELILNSAYEGILGLDMEGRHTFVNPSAARMLGYEVNELIGKKSHPTWHHSKPDGGPYPKEQCPLHKALADGISFDSSDEVLWKKEGTSFSAGLAMKPILDGGKPIGAVVTFRDITLRKQNECDLKEQEEELSAIYNSAPLIMMLVDPERKVLKVNNLGASFAAASNSTMVGRRSGEALGCLHALDDPKGCGFGPSCGNCPVRSIVMNTFETGQNHHQVEVSMPFLTGAGDEGLVFLLSTTKLNVREKPMALVSILDITKRKRAEEALRQSEERFRTIFEAAQDLIYIRDPQLRLTHVNPSMEKTFGLSAAELIGRTPQELFTAEQAAHTTDIFRRVLDGQTVELEHVLTVNGVDGRFHSILTPLHDNSGNVVGVFGISRDIAQLAKPEFSAAQIGQYPSKAMNSTLNKANIAARMDSTVLLLGESGSGKDYLARYIHNHSNRADGPFFSINCASITPSLAESELFGHERGAFTGAASRKRGLLELAEGGCLLLNEIGELSLPLQAKLLTFLDTKKFVRVGGEREITVNARLVAATNRDLEKETEAGSFRKDLFFRLNVFSLYLPPLRERVEDIPVLINELMSKIQAELQLPALPIITTSVLRALQDYSWPGNVRELRNVLERSVILTGGTQIDLDTLGLKTRHGQSPDDWQFTAAFPSHGSVGAIFDNFRLAVAEEALRRSDGSRTKAARLLGISRDSFYRYIKKPETDDNLS